MTAYEVSKKGFLDEHVKHIRTVYRERRDVMLEMMDEMFPSEVCWTHPLGGMFLWGILPDYMDAGEVLKMAIERKVAFVPGQSFHPDGSGKNTMRLNFSYSNPETIREGITRLGMLLKELVAQTLEELSPDFAHNPVQGDLSVREPMSPGFLPEGIQEHFTQILLRGAGPQGFE